MANVEALNAAGLERGWGAEWAGSRWFGGREEGRGSGYEEVSRWRRWHCGSATVGVGNGGRRGMTTGYVMFRDDGERRVAEKAVSAGDDAGMGVGR
jgi:hypothetical protein